MNTDVINILKNGGLGVIPTDTIYGVVGFSLNSETVEKIYKLRKRSSDKPFIILVSQISDLEKFEVKSTEKQKEFLEENWPNPLSVVLSCSSEKWEYLHRGTQSLAFRMPNNKKLLDLLKQTGSLVAPSANFEGEKPAENIAEAKKYFGDSVDFYIDEGSIFTTASTLIELKLDGNYKILRKGSFRIG